MRRMRTFSCLRCYDTARVLVNVGLPGWTDDFAFVECSCLPAEPASQERCRAGSDGDCNWAECPQEANNRANYQQWCPLAGPASQEAPRD